MQQILYIYVDHILNYVCPQSTYTLLVLRAWESLSDATCCQSLAIVYGGKTILQIGFAAASSDGDGEAVAVDADKLIQGSLYRGVMKSGVRK